jgi:predicted nucleic acid-binding protein
VIVLDASAAVHLLLGTEAGARVRLRVSSSEVTLHVPEVFDLEVASVLRRLERLREITPTRAARATSDLAVLDAVRYPHGDLMVRVWALRHTLTTYDAAYVALAESLRAPIVTTDSKLSRTRAHTAAVEVIA